MELHDGMRCRILAERVLQGSPERLEVQVLQAIQVLQDLLEVRPIQVLQDLLDNEAMMGFLVEQVRLDLSEQDPLVQSVQDPRVLLVQPAILELLVHLRL